MRKQIIGGLATAAALTIGVVGATAYAETPPPTPSPSTSPQTPRTGDADKEHNEPTYTGSIAAPKDTGTENETTESDAAESAALAALAKISEADARAAALTQFPGATVQKASLEDENGSVVWSIELTDANKVAQDVKVDAGNGTILAVEAGGDESEGNESEGAEASDVPGAED